MSLDIDQLEASPSLLVQEGETELFDAADIRWRLALRVAESPSFAGAPLLAKFLLFVCECSISGRADELTERNIGIEVFQRRPNFKTSEDNIVRSYVRQLRQRLEKYFQEHAADEPLKIVIPRGGYVAVFEPQAARLIPSTASEFPRNDAPAIAEDVHSGRGLVLPKHWLAWALMLFVAGGATGAWVVHWRAEASPAHALWSELFAASQNTYIVSADSGLVVMEELSGKPATLEGYLNGRYFSQFDKASTPQELTLQRLSRERYTGVPDIDTTVAITLLPEARSGKVALRNARALTMDDIKSSNLILMGSDYSTPWVSLFESHLNFRFKYDASIYSSYFINSKPLSGESVLYQNGSTSPPFATYAVIAFLPNLSGAGKVLVMEGLTTAGTEAASDFLLSREMGLFLTSVPRDQHGLRPFELLLKTTSLDSKSSTAEIISRRIY